MNHEKSKKTDSQDLVSVLNAAQKLYVHVQQITDQNNTTGILISDNNDETDQPDPLRVHEIIIVICVLLLWCASIFVFIRHSQILRIRHRDIPFRSSTKPSIHLNHITITTRTSDAVIYSKSRVSSTGGITPPIGKHMINGYPHNEIIETISLSVSPSSKKKRYTPSLDRNKALMAKYSFDKHDDKEQLLAPHRISTDIRENLLDLHRKSMDNLSAIKYSTFYSANDVRNRQQNDNQYLVPKKRCIQESPV